MSPNCTAPPETRVWQRWPSCTGSTPSTERPWPRWPPSSASGWSSWARGAARRGRRRCGARGGDPVFGPSGEAAQLEGSKAFAKDVMAAAGVPTARSYVCTTADEVEEALDAFGAPYVVKDDGLAAGKGVVVTDDLEAAKAHAATASAWSSRSTSTDPRSPCSPSPTARRSCRSSRHRTSSARWTATRGRTPVAWGRTRRCRGPGRSWSRTSWRAFSSRQSTRCAAAAPPSPVCCTRAWRSPRAVSGSSSSTPGSVIPRRRSSSPG